MFGYFADRNPVRTVTITTTKKETIDKNGKCNLTGREIEWELKIKSKRREYTRMNYACADVDYPL